jgi:intracellular multiplication protein IcmL
MPENDANNLRNIFYRNRYNRLFYLLRIMVFVNLILAAILIYFMTHAPIAATYASHEGKNTTLYPLPEPIVSQNALLSWATQAAISAYTFDYVNYKSALQQASHYFSPQGWSLYQHHLQPLLNAVISKKLKLAAVAVGPPVIVEEGPLLGRYSWSVRIPILVSYESATEVQQQSLLVSMVVTRVSTLMTTKGIAIAQFYTTQR